MLLWSKSPTTNKKGKEMPKNTLAARIKAYEAMLKGGVVRGVKQTSADSRAFHKPGSTKK
jgi:hypothetical protein